MQDLTHKPVSAFVAAVGSFGQDGNFELEGTAFMVGARGFMLTAAHVVDALKTKTRPVAMFMDHTGASLTAKIVDFESHDIQDAAVLKLEGSDWASIHDLSAERQFGSAEVMMWAYPEVAAKEHQNTVPPAHPDASKVQPDLIYFQGYVRRRVSRELPVAILRGNAFYEVSQIGGACASGAPITLRVPGKLWQVVGIYIGEQTSDARREIGIAVRVDAILDWVPRIVGSPVVHERHTHT
ncbi:MAG TPA: trypsin-like peptidase domain-containing protein [Caulobacteraceae bacterium]|nr:trypsin-like peptidase domain-containing protein [Caulobacteraceae bacterium]